MISIESKLPRSDGTHRVSSIWTDCNKCDLCDQERDCLMIMVDIGGLPMVRICLECLGKGLIDMARTP